MNRQIGLQDEKRRRTKVYRLIREGEIRGL